MSKYARKVDASQPEIVKALRKAGCRVEIIGRPVDLLVWHPRFGGGTFKALECKTPKGKAGKLKLRKDQQEQAAFVAETGTAYATTPEAALAALGLA